MIKSRVSSAVIFGAVFFNLAATSMARAEALQCRQMFPKPVMTQSELIEEGLKEYFPNLIENIKENIEHLTGFSDFDFFQALHQQNPKKSFFRLLKKNSYRNQPQKEWSFSFYNNGASFSDILTMEFGLCSGMTSTLRKFNLLANFDATVSRSIPDRENHPKEWLKYYTDKIDQIIDYKMTTIEGFENLYSFSSDPEIQKFIRESVVERWKENNVNLLQGAADGFLSVNQVMTKEDFQELHTDLKQRLEYGYNPIVYLSKPAESLFSKKQWIHVVMVIGVSAPKADGSFSVEIWDSNYPAQKAKRIIDISSSGEINLEGANLNMIKLLRWDDLEIERIIKANLPE
jgi:hypothetical protein